MEGCIFTDNAEKKKASKLKWLNGKEFYNNYTTQNNEMHFFQIKN